MCKGRVIYVMVISILLSRCSVTSIDKEFINQVMGVYQLKNSNQSTVIGNQGNIYQNNEMIYQLYQVKTKDWAIYKIHDLSLGVGFVSVVYRTAILYIGKIATNPDDVSFSDVSSYGIRVN